MKNNENKLIYLIEAKKNLNRKQSENHKKKKNNFRKTFLRGKSVRLNYFEKTLRTF